ncbi:hypothetical protein C0992_006595 [Termitomyces sp. T32_za158]|nr:hypothetical protein C0992_006595 [Termitomyces sp. T32_za158]
MSLRTSKQATVKDKGTKPPVVSEGDLTPETIKEFEHACLDFFDNKEVKPEDQVRRVLVSFKDHRLRNWISANREQLHKLSFSDFLTELKSKYLPHDWESKLHIRILSASFDATKQSWHLEAKLDPALSLLYFEKEINEELDFNRWLDHIHIQDKMRHHTEKRQHEIADEVVCLSKKPLLSSNRYNSNTSS